jgi:hypothetical protein
MIGAEEYQVLGEGLALWHAFDPKAKAELFSTACRTPRGTLLIDPISLADHALKPLLEEGPLLGIAVTNSNHWRASAYFAQRFAIPVFAHPDTNDEAGCPFEPLTDGRQIFDFIDVITIPGGAPGEIALHLPGKKASLIVGDALIHFEPYGFALLPSKYCVDHKQMQQSLRKLLPFGAERMLFAHGTPLLSGADNRLQHLLDHGD